MTWVEGEEIARGATARVLRGEPGTVVKVFEPQVPVIVAQLEAAATRVASDAGLPVAALVEARLDASPPRLVLEYVDGVPLGEYGQEAGPAAVGALLAELQHAVRAVARPTLVSIADYMTHQLGTAPVPRAWRDAALGDLASLAGDPADHVLSHMDLHPLNVLWAGRPVMIDWSNGMAAPPAADVARTRLLLDTARHWVSPEVWPFLADAAEAYAARTEELAPGLVEESRAWDRLLQTARFDERPPPAEVHDLTERLTRGER